MPVAAWAACSRAPEGTPGAHPEGHPAKAYPEASQRARGQAGRSRRARNPSRRFAAAARRATEIFRLEVERRAAELGLQELRWPDPFPFDSALAMRAATYAKSIGRVVAFAQAAFRQAFAGGHTLGETDRVLIAAAACEMHPTAMLKAELAPPPSSSPPPPPRPPSWA